MTPAELDVLVAELDRLVASTWHKLEVGPTRGLKFGEESITDHNLFELDRTSRAVDVYKFEHPEEVRGGADFDLYVGSATQQWVGTRFQAKKLDDGAYQQLGHTVATERQYDVLLRRAAADGVSPFYYFYNGWPGPWPDGVRNKACPKAVTPTRVGNPKGCTHADLEDFGCAAAPAAFVAARHRSPVPRGRLELDDYLAQSRPWSHLFRGPKGRPLDAHGMPVLLGAALGAWADEADDAATRHDPARRPADADFPDDRIHPPRPGLLGELPPWLEAARQGVPRQTGGYRPRAAAVVDVGE